MEYSENLVRIGPLFRRAEQWTEEHVLTSDVALQAATIIALIALAFFVQRLVRPLFQRFATFGAAGGGLRRILETATGLIGVFLFLVLLAVTSQILQETSTIQSPALLRIAINLVLAWALIRLSSSVIADPLASKIIAAFAWILAALNILGFLKPATTALDAIGMQLGSARITALTVINGAILLAILLWAAFALGTLVDRRLLSVAQITPRTRVLIGKILRFVLLTVAGLVTLSSIGVNLSTLAVFTGALGVGIGIGLQHQVSNIVSGLFLLLDKSIKPGDVIEVGDTYGSVREMSARYVGVVTRDNKEILIPNDTFVLQQVVNWSHNDKSIRIDVGFGVSYAADPRNVQSLAVAAAKTPKRVAVQPPPVCHLREFGDSSLNFVLRFWINDPESGVTNVKGEVLIALWDTFKANGVDIPYPHRHVIIDKNAR